jgi:nicotinamide mononucleotide transporter
MTSGSAMSLLEAIAFVVSIVGVWLTTARSLWNYPFSLLSVGLYGAIFYQAKLYADMGLQGIFAGTLFYGLWQWLRGRSASGDLLITRVHADEVVISIAAGVVTAGALGFLLSTHTDASLPWIDSFLFAVSLVASVWTARRNIESWWIWITVDVLYVGVYLFKHLYLTAVLYAVFIGLAVLGLRRWQSAFDSENTAPHFSCRMGPKQKNVVY